MANGMKYDREADAIYISLSQASCAYTKVVSDLIAVDYSEDDEPVGVEILCVSQITNFSGLPHVDKIARVLGCATPRDISERCTLVSQR